MSAFTTTEIIEKITLATDRLAEAMAKNDEVLMLIEASEISRWSALIAGQCAEGLKPHHLMAEALAESLCKRMEDDDR